MFGNVRVAFEQLLDNLRKVVGNLRKIIKNVDISMFYVLCGFYVITTKLHGRLQIPNFSSVVEKYFNSLLRHSKRNFVSPHGQVLSSIKGASF